LDILQLVVIEHCLVLWRTSRRFDVDRALKQHKLYPVGYPRYSTFPSFSFSFDNNSFFIYSTFLTKQQSNKATKQQSNKATKQQSNKATKQQSNKATKQQSNKAMNLYLYVSISQYLYLNISISLYPSISLSLPLHLSTSPPLYLYLLLHRVFVTKSRVECAH
jgi:hypothetical protein